jgi:phosphoribosylformimino-5-aminoimidazole carboxamide ribotide isomerase
LSSVLEGLEGRKDKLVIDISCRRKNMTWFVAMNKWQTLTDVEVNQGYRLVPSEVSFKC